MLRCQWGFFAPNEPQRRGIDTILPLHLEKPVTTMNKKLIINVAPTGAFVTKDQNPTQPQTPQEIAKEVMNPTKPGRLCLISIAGEMASMLWILRSIRETLDLVFAEAPEYYNKPLYHFCL